MRFGTMELLIILFLVLLLFGAKKLPDMMKGLGKGLREFKKAVKTEDDNLLESEKVEEEDK